MPSADLIVDLSPPRSNKAVSLDLSPSTYIRDPGMLASLRRKASLDIGSQIHKKCTLEPPPVEEDRTILQYYDRVYESVSKEKLSVRIPGQGIVKLLNDGQVMSPDSHVSLEYGLIGLGMREKSGHRHPTK